MTDFLANLATQMNNQFSPEVISDISPEAIASGQSQHVGSLGDIQARNKYVEHRYVEEGYLRTLPYTVDTKQFEVLFQEPNATILVKKNMFSSISENYRPDYMDQDEKIYFKAAKILLQNKCAQIAALEKLSKIQKVTAAVGSISDQLMPIIIGLTDTLNEYIGGGSPAGSYGNIGNINPSTNQDATALSQVVERVRRIAAFNSTNPVTTWITDTTNMFQSQLGQGTGVIEITNFTNLNTTVTNDLQNPGSFNFTISDPYEAMRITSWDIEKALSDATNAFYNSKTYQFGQQTASQVVNDAKTRLSQLRSARGAGDINIMTAPSTTVGTPVIAIIARTGVQIQFTYDVLGSINGSVNVSSAYLHGGEVAGFEGLATNTNGTAGIGPDSNIRPLVPQSELSVFQQLITAVYNQLQLQNSAQTAFQGNMKNTNYARRKLNFQFLGRQIIQPMDTVHIYIGSKSRYDSGLLNGLQSMFSGFGILQNINHTPTTPQPNSTSSLFNPSGNIQMQAEKAAYVGPNFPNYLWVLLRNQFVTEKEGTHVFAGVVSTAPSSYQSSNGSFMVNVTGTDNTTYFDQGQINFKPSIDVFNGVLFDPLTPFKTSFDTITSNAKSDTPVLLPENQSILGTSKDSSPFLRNKLGPLAGQPAYSDNIIQNRTINNSTNSVGKVLYAPDGLVYKWKEGIGVLVQYGSSIDINDASNIGNPSIAQDPFAGQDIMNVISLLITGIPYNYATYLKAVQTFDGSARDPYSRQDAAYSFYASLKTDLSRNNVTWGNFIPYKNLVIDEASFAKQIDGQMRANRTNKDLDDKIQQYNALKRQVNMFAAASTQATQAIPKLNTYENEAQEQLTTLTSEIRSLISSLQNADQSFSAGALSPNGDPSFASGTFDASVNTKQSLSDAKQRQNLRRQLNNLTRRMSYNVRANEDKNLFIVDDNYDKDYDIMAYEQSLSDGVKLFNSEFMTVRQKIIATAGLLNLEVFADTQGHIRVRSPQYNRMPSSIFYRMMYLKKAYGIQIFPQFMEDLFTGQIDTLIQRLETLENQIRLDCAVLGFNTDAACTDFILNGNSSANSPQTSNSYSGSGVSTPGETFSFLSAEGISPNYSFKVTNVSALTSAADPSNYSSNITQSLNSQAASTKVPFNNSQRFQYLSMALEDNPLPLASNQRITALIQAIKTETGQQIPNDYFLVSNSQTDNGVSTAGSQSVDVFKVTQDLSNYVKERQKVLKLLAGAIKNSQELTSLDNNSNVANELLNPAGYGNSNIPEVFEHMIEDEAYDDYGIGSGSRYIIRSAQIRNFTIGESAPPFTMVEVKGQFDPFLSSTQLPPELNSFPGGGNGLVTAAAIDYDMWRRYGYKGTSPVNVPFLKDPNTQCAPYASMLLTQARKNTLRGTLTISGNEYMQPGEVIFIEDHQMLYYVTSVRHSFAYGGSFTTTLDLTYGHAPGDYIPSMLDVVGKMLYANKDLATTSIQRQSSSLNDNNIGIIVSDPSGGTTLATGDPNSSPTNSFTAANSNTIGNILYQAAYMINANESKGNTVSANVELRIYYDSTIPLNGTLQTFAQTVLGLLINPPAGPVQQYNSNTGNAPPPIPSANISVVTVQTDAPNEMRSPSQKAIDMARNLINTNGSNGGQSSSPTNSQQQVKTNLFSYVVDCWINFAQVSTNVAQQNGQ